MLVDLQTETMTSHNFYEKQEIACSCVWTYSTKYGYTNANWNATMLSDVYHLYITSSSLIKKKQSCLLNAK